MYFHGGASGVSTDQVTFVASSKDGLDFAASPARLASFYLRVFEHDGWFYGVGKRGNRSGILVRSEDPTAPFEAGATIIPRLRHAAVLKRDDDEAWVLYTRIGDEPESILAARIDLRGAWSCWRPEAGALVIAPERGYEGAEEPVEPSRPGIADGRRHELRDPAVYVEGHRTFLLYCVAGEQGIAIAELRPVS